MILVTDNVPGNLHEAAMTINKRGLADHVLAMDFINGVGYTVVVYRMTIEERNEALARGVLR